MLYGLGSKVGSKLSTPRYETPGYEKVRVRNVWKPWEHDRTATKTSRFASYDVTMLIANDAFRL